MCCTVLHELLSTLVYHSSRVDATEEPRKAQIAAQYTNLQSVCVEIKCVLCLYQVEQVLLLLTLTWRQEEEEVRVVLYPPPHLTSLPLPPLPLRDTLT